MLPVSVLGDFIIYQIEYLRLPCGKVLLCKQMLTKYKLGKKYSLYELPYKYYHNQNMKYVNMQDTIVGTVLLHEMMMVVESDQCTMGK